MTSPFPGMNPYLEQPSVWEDFHNRFAAYAGESLAAQVRPHFLVKLEERVFIHEPSGDDRRKLLGRPDVALLEGLAGNSTAVATVAPEVNNQVQSVIASLSDVDIERHAYIEIRDRQNRELVTMIELLSPSNKRYGPYHDQYVAKRTALMFSTASLVEIDLLRGGPRFPLNDLPPSDYSVAVYRKRDLPKVEAWPIGLRDPLPVIPIPLKGEFPDATLDLQALLHRVYDAAGYEDYIYESNPEPPLEGADLAWAQSILNSPKSS
ncbi:MAG: DUF4058 family protein [Pirellula sp.]|jgi:hypothetical protein|nr:DUF4058 family protein [Pirellula sp.]